MWPSFQDWILFRFLQDVRARWGQLIQSHWIYLGLNFHLLRLDLSCSFVSTEGWAVCYGSDLQAPSCKFYLLAWQLYFRFSAFSNCFLLGSPDSQSVWFMNDKCFRGRERIQPGFLSVLPFSSKHYLQTWAALLSLNIKIFLSRSARDLKAYSAFIPFIQLFLPDLLVCQATLLMNQQMVWGKKSSMKCHV